MRNSKAVKTIVGILALAIGLTVAYGWITGRFSVKVLGDIVLTILAVAAVASLVNRILKE